MMTRSRSFALIAALGLGQIAALASSFYLFAVLGDPIAHGLGIAPGLMFGLVSAMLLVQGLLGPASGRWIERWGAKRVLLASNLVYAAALATIAVAPSLPLLAVGMLTIGVAMTAGTYGSAFALAVELFEDRARSAITAIALLGGLGSGLGWLISSATLSEWGWRGACLGWAAIHVGLCLPLVWLLAPVRAHQATQQARATVGWDATMLRLTILFSGSWLVATCIGAHLPRLLAKLGLSPAAAVGAASLLGVAAVSARLAEIVVLRRASPIVTARVACLLHPAGAVLLLVAGPIAASGFVMGQGFANGLLSVASGTLPLLLFGKKDYAVRCAMLITPAKLLQAAGPLLYEVVLARSAQGALVLTSAIYVAMFVVTLGLGQKGRTASQASVAV